MTEQDRTTRVHMWVVGKVQGVWFRASTAERATALGLRGWVRNLADGRVEVVAEGPRAPLESLVAFCRQGPPLARVDEVDLRWEEPLGEGPFEVRRYG